MVKTENHKQRTAIFINALKEYQMSQTHFPNKLLAHVQKTEQVAIRKQSVRISCGIECQYSSMQDCQSGSTAAGISTGNG